MGWNEEKKKSLLFLLAGVLCLALAGCLLVVFSGRVKNVSSGMVAGPALSTKQPDVSPSPVDPTPSPAEPWVLYVTGAVRSPGVYRLPPGARAYQLVDAAGGLRSDADAVTINLAMPLQDGAHFHVSSVASVQTNSPSSPSREGSLAGTGGSVSAAKGKSAEATPVPIDVNRATQEELERLPGIGPKTAAAIIGYRTSNGPFRSVEDLRLVKGIGPKKLEAIRSSVVVR